MFLSCKQKILPCRAQKVLKISKDLNGSYFLRYNWSFYQYSPILGIVNPPVVDNDVPWFIIKTISLKPLEIKGAYFSPKEALEYGFYYGVSDNPVDILNGEKIVIGTSDNLKQTDVLYDFTSLFNNLIKGSTYYFMSYIKKTNGIELLHYFGIYEFFVPLSDSLDMRGFVKYPTGKTFIQSLDLKGTIKNRTTMMTKLETTILSNRLSAVSFEDNLSIFNLSGNGSGEVLPSVSIGYRLEEIESGLYPRAGFILDGSFTGIEGQGELETGFILYPESSQSYAFTSGISSNDYNQLNKPALRLPSFFSENPVDNNYSNYPIVHYSDTIEDGCFSKDFRGDPFSILHSTTYKVRAFVKKGFNFKFSETISFETMAGAVVHTPLVDRKEFWLTDYDDEGNEIRVEVPDFSVHASCTFPYRLPVTLVIYLKRHSTGEVLKTAAQYWDGTDIPESYQYGFSGFFNKRDFLGYTNTLYLVEVRLVPGAEIDFISTHINRKTTTFNGFSGYYN
ncbi:MAG: hypothetical protein RBS92_08465 [Candidatus Cloacimonadales bacterium]|jgi:hypothetical protein|nr:hypothetical protein [Candidatus Cloacimonadales bacterium]